MKSIFQIAAIALCIILSIFANSNYGQENKTEKTTKQFIYKLKLIPSLLNANNWTEKENNIVGDHFNRLKNYTEKGVVILAGRTINNDETQFGIVIFEAENNSEAETFMNEDPAVKEKIMTAELFPFNMALIRNKR